MGDAPRMAFEGAPLACEGKRLVRRRAKDQGWQCPLEDCHFHIDPGDISEQTALRNKLQCKPFKWFMENIAFDLTKKYPPVEPPNFGDGFIKSLMDSNMCADATDTAFTKRYIPISGASMMGGQSGQLPTRFFAHPDLGSY